MTEPTISVDSVLDHYANAVAAKDVASLMRLYDPRVRVFDAWERWVYEGAAAWETAVRAWFHSLGAESVRVTFEDTQSFAEPDLAIVSTIVRYTGISAQGSDLRFMQNRLTWAIRRSNLGPRIIHEHTSAPIGFSEMKAILKR